MPPFAWFPMRASRSWSRGADLNRDYLSASPWPRSLVPVPGPDIMPTSEAIRKALRAVKDPELNLNIIDIGLVYDVEADDTGDVRVEMTLTSPGCPAGAEIIGDVKRVIGDMEGVRSVEVELVWEPYWTPEKMDPRVRTFLGF
jgi:metal-sulfur cluster biosynthetic enzyme